MNIGFYLTGQDPLGFIFADRLIRSAREVMPGVPICQLTDDRTPMVWGTDAVKRRTGQALSLLRSTHYSMLSGDWLLVDTDVIIQRDVRHVMEADDFDIAVTDRDWSHLKELPKSYTDEMPYCAGVVFSRCPVFWLAVHEEVRQMDCKSQEWFGDQKAIATIIQRAQFRIRVLPGSVYQYPPLADSDGRDAAIMHYKGPDRKTFLINRIRRELWNAPVV